MKSDPVPDHRILQEYMGRRHQFRPDLLSGVLEKSPSHNAHQLSAKPPFLPVLLRRHAPACALPREGRPCYSNPGVYINQFSLILVFGGKFNDIFWLR